MTVRHTLEDPDGDSITASIFHDGSVKLRCVDCDGSEQLVLLDIGLAEFKLWTEAVNAHAER